MDVDILVGMDDMLGALTDLTMVTVMAMAMVTAMMGVTIGDGEIGGHLGYDIIIGGPPIIVSIMPPINV
jgi:hypothetical protein